MAHALLLSLPEQTNWEGIRMAGTEEKFGAKGGGGSGGSGGPGGGGRGAGGGGGGGRRWRRDGRRRWWWPSARRWRRRSSLTLPNPAGRRGSAAPRFFVDAFSGRHSLVAAVDHSASRDVRPAASLALAGRRDRHPSRESPAGQRDC